MPRFAILISQKAEAAFFERTLEVAQAELAGLPDVALQQVQSIGGMHFLHVEAPEAVPLARLAAAQGVFAVGPEGLAPLDQGTGFHLHPDFVFGEKYRGKTNETLTQLLINLCLQELPAASQKLRLLDPMCGRGTSLLWALRYGMDGVGVELDGAALPEIKRGLKKWTKLHRQKHKIEEGWVQKTNRQGVGKFLDFLAEGQRMRVITGDARQAWDLTHRKPFDLLVTDVPYGVQHMSGRAERSPLAILREAAPVWRDCLREAGVMALAFNAYLPKRAALCEVFEAAGFTLIERDLSHRMSESILRDVLLARR